jgi:hypothetical protein
MQRKAEKKKEMLRQILMKRRAQVQKSNQRHRKAVEPNKTQKCRGRVWHIRQRKSLAKKGIGIR